MKNQFTQSVPVEIEDTEILADVTYVYTKGDPGCMYQRNGDPGWPPEPPECEVVKVQIANADSPEWFYRAVADSERVYSWLVSNHAEPEREYERED